MCEQYVARAAEPFRIDELWPFPKRLERYGLAGFGWGAAWLRADGPLCSHRAADAFRDGPEVAACVGREETTPLRVHPERPPQLPARRVAVERPFNDPAGRFSFSHNG